MGAYWGVSGLANKCGRDVHLSDSHSLVFTCSFFFFHGTSVLFFKKLVTFTLLIASLSMTVIYFSFLVVTFLSCLHS